MKTLLVAAVVAAVVLIAATALSGQPSGDPILVVETSRGSFTVQTFPRDAPKTVAHIVALARQGFYDGQRIHRALPGLLVQFGDPQSRDLTKRDVWGRGAAASSGTPIGISEVSTRLLHQPGAVGVAHMGEPAKADSQIYVMLDRRPELDGLYTIFARVIEGQDVPASLRGGDEIVRVYVRN
jgi:peptidyl-prolyl cis-trans isomerase B (cyclophilin B)